MPSAADDLSPSLAQALRDATSALRRLFRAAACSVAVLEADGSQLRFIAASGEGEEAVAGLRLPATRGIAGWVVTSGMALVVADVRQDPRFAREVAESTGYVPQVITAAPLTGPNGVTGVVEVLDPAAREHDLDGLAAAAVLLAGMVAVGPAPGGTELGRAAEQLEQQGPAATALGLDLLSAASTHVQRSPW